MTDHCTGCTDVVLRGAGDAMPSSSGAAKQVRERRADEITQTTSPDAVTSLHVALSSEFHSSAPIEEGSPTKDSTVLRL
jgi:hypothetical protein